MKRASTETLDQSGAKKRKVSAHDNILKALKIDSPEELSQIILDNGNNILNELTEENLHITHVAASKNAIKCFEYLVNAYKQMIDVPYIVNGSNPVHFAAQSNSNNKIINLCKQKYEIACLEHEVEELKIDNKELKKEVKEVQNKFENLYKFLAKLHPELGNEFIVSNTPSDKNYETDMAGEVLTEEGNIS